MNQVVFTAKDYIVASQVAYLNITEEDMTLWRTVNSGKDFPTLREMLIFKCDEKNKG